MDDSNRSQLIPLATVVLLATAAGGWLFYPKGMRSFRPEVPEAAVVESTDIEDVSARLWQDPLSAVADFRKQGGHQGAASAAHDLSALRESIMTRLSSTDEGRLLIMPVMVLGGQHAESIEERRRQRYAVIAGLGRRDFVPEIDSKIGFVETVLPAVDDTAGGGGAVTTGADAGDLQRPAVEIPFEWYESAGHHERSEGGTEVDLPDRVLVLWIDEIQVLRHPFILLSSFLTAVSPTRAGTSTVDPRLDFKVIGPATSTSLRFLLKDMSRVSSDGNESPVASRLQFYSSRPTRWPALFDPEEQRTYCQLANRSGRPSESSEMCRDISHAPPSREPQLVVTISNDHTVLDGIVDELDRRGVNVVPDADGPPDHIAMIGEWDTHYGRALSRTLRTILCEKTGRTASECLEATSEQTGAATSRVEEFHYLRGIDGLIPGAENRTDEQTAPADGTDTLDLRRMEQPEGRSQLDYVRRLAEVIATRDREIRSSGSKGITAVGVAGSDLYDKQLILQALRSQLPNAIFFTTDLDARLFHPSQYDWSRNLIVGSSFGLTLRPELQGTIPPFRNVYQTSTFLATQLALGTLTLDPESSASEPINDSVDTYLTSPRIFEVARSGGYDLSPDPDRDGLHPPTSQNRPRILTRPWAFVLLALAPLALVPFSSTARRWLFFWLRNPEDEEQVPVRIQIIWLYPVLVLLGMIFVTSPTGRSVIEPGAARWILLAFVVLAVVLLVVPITRRWLLRSRTVSRSTPRVILSVQAIFLVALALLLWAVFVNANSPTGEPLALLQGISVWPTEMIRLFAVMMSVFFMVNAALDLRYSNRNIEQRYGLPSFDCRAAGRPGGSRADRSGVVAWIPNLWRWAKRNATQVAETDWQRRNPTPSWARSIKCQTQGLFTEDDSDPTRRTMRHRVVGVADLWLDYQRRGCPRSRALRITLWFVAYLVFFSVIFQVFGRPPVPARGDVARWIDGWLTFASSLGLVISALFVLDSHNLTGKLTRCFEHNQTFWPKEALDMARLQRGIEHSEATEWLEVNFIAERTAVVGNFVVFPFVILTVLMLARNSYFDLWTWPMSLILVFAVLSMFIIASGLVLRRSAESARSRSLRNLTNLLSRLEASADDEKRRRIPVVRMVMDDISSIRTGAFSAWSDNPVLRAIMLPFGGTGIMVLFDLLGKFGM